MTARESLCALGRADDVGDRCEHGGVEVFDAHAEARAHHIVAICTRGRDRQAISLEDLPLPSPRPAGSEWIEAYRHWLGGR